MDLFELREPTVRDCLRHNILPSDKDRREILASLALAQARLSEMLFDSVSDNPSGYLGHSAEAVRLEHYITEYSSLLAPIRLLSVDILQTIFLDPDVYDSSKMEKEAPPFKASIVEGYIPEIVASVSYHWRNVACGIAKLWSSFRVNFQRGNSLSRVQLYLERSKDASLSISFHWTRYNGCDENMALRLTQEVLKHAERWAQVAFPMLSSFLELLAPARGRLNRLEAISLDFSQYDPASDPARLPFITVFQDLPKLRHLSTHSMRREFPPLPWHQLERVSVYLGYRAISEGGILTRTSNLRELVINHSPNDLPESLNPSLSALQKIVLLGEDALYEPGLMPVFNRLIAPALTEIFLVDCGVWNSRNIESLVQRSGCHLQKLVLQRTRVRAVELLEFLPAIPTLHALILMDLFPNSITDLLIDALNLSSPSSFLPALNTLVLDGIYLFSTDKLLTMLESRTSVDTHCSPLTIIDITLSGREIAPPDLHRFAELRVAGYSRMGCLDQTKTPVEIHVGETAQLRPIWKYRHPPLSRGAQNITQPGPQF
ncbi:hypothetical protein B0H11DRAFT_2107192 [Mycena galericulata]|nr:hypothetical protein B0H11DRAFT_2107192 [Mycena galericulata]